MVLLGADIPHRAFWCYWSCCIPLCQSAIPKLGTKAKPERGRCFLQHYSSCDDCGVPDQGWFFITLCSCSCQNFKYTITSLYPKTTHTRLSPLSTHICLGSKKNFTTTTTTTGDWCCCCYCCYYVFLFFLTFSPSSVTLVTPIYSKDS